MVDFLQILQNYRVYVYYMYLKIKCFAIVVFTQPPPPQVSLLNVSWHIYIFYIDTYHDNLKHISNLHRMNYSIFISCIVYLVFGF